MERWRRRKNTPPVRKNQSLIPANGDRWVDSTKEFFLAHDKKIKSWEW
uniref:Uncharacterized protein n=1 Tax=Siphoviridae sp. ctS3r5 TaxID=2826341 RepID=A0A8S5N9T6_9CAUD|nr:MAG TPA: hypothetical protein [Siphoviridae sp. ctS3r5]